MGGALAHPRRHGEASPEAFAEQGSCGIDFANGAALVPADAFAEQREEAPASFDVRDLLVHRKGNGNG